MHTFLRLRPALLASCLALPLLLGSSGCGDDGDQDQDGGASDMPADGAAGENCAPSACDGLPVPEIACADGPTIVVCERGGDGPCRPSVRCGEDDAGSHNDAGSDSDAGGKADAGDKPMPGETCGGFAGLSCPAKQFCNYEVSAGGMGCDGISDASGVCQVQPEACTEEYDPVCGCDRRSYSNACFAHADGVSVLRKGLCTAQECMDIGGRAEYSDGASIPKCKDGEDSFALPGIEPALCCV